MATPYLQIAGQMVLLGGGLGLTFAPATEAIMGSLPADEAGIGSAVNDTTRELGGTLGDRRQRLRIRLPPQALLDSASALTSLPADLRSTMKQSTAAAYEFIRATATPRRPPACAIPSTTPSSAVCRSAPLVCAAIALIAAVIVAVLLPARARRPATETTELAESEAVVA